MFKKIRRDAVEKFLASHATGARVLDIGGSRASGHSYDRYFPNRMTVDVDPARKPDVIADAHSLTFGDGEFEVVVCTEVLEHLTNPPKALGEIYRVLKPGGTLILTTPFVYPVHDAPHDYFRYTNFGLAHMLRDWKDVSITPSTPAFTTLGVLLQRIAFQSDVRGGKITKALLMFCAWICTTLNWLIKKEYGDIKRTAPLDGGMLASGYHVVAHKPQ